MNLQVGKFVCCNKKGVTHTTYKYPRHSFTRNMTWVPASLWSLFLTLFSVKLQAWSGSVYPLCVECRSFLRNLQLCILLQLHLTHIEKFQLTRLHFRFRTWWKHSTKYAFFSTENSNKQIERDCTPIFKSDPWRHIIDLSSHRNRKMLNVKTTARKKKWSWFQITHIESLFKL